MRKIIVTLTALLACITVSTSYAEQKDTKLETSINPQEEQHEPTVKEVEAELYKDEDDKLKGLESAPVTDESGDEQE